MPVSFTLQQTIYARKGTHQPPSDMDYYDYSSLFKHLACSLPPPNWPKAIYREMLALNNHQMEVWKKCKELTVSIKSSVSMGNSGMDRIPQR
jgi:hypothetical protein